MLIPVQADKTIIPLQFQAIKTGKTWTFTAHIAPV